MSAQLKTVTQKVWSNITTMGNRPAAHIKNEGPSEHQQAVYASPYGHSSVYYVDVRPPVLGISWHDYGHMVAEATLFLRAHNIKKGDRVAILGRNSLEWMVINRAIQGMGAITVPLYPNTNPHTDPNTNAELNSHILRDSGSILLLVDSQKENATIDATKFPQLVRAMFQEVLAAVPEYNGKSGRKPLVFRTEAQAEFACLKAKYADGVMAPDAQLDDVSTLIYTSGSTSLPKGAMHTHKSIAASCELLVQLGFDFGAQDVILHYLPFAHIYGKVNGLELSERFAVVSTFCAPEELKDAMRLYRPTILMGVPRVWNRIKSEIEKQAANKGLKATLLRWALRQKKHGLFHDLADMLVLSTVREKMGADRIRLTVSGSAAIPIETIEFFDVLGMQLREGYGLTETCGGMSANTLTVNKFGSLGKPGPGCEIRLERREIDTEEGTGILWVRGDFLFTGYWNKPDKTAAAFKDGWFNTEDIVHEDADGFLWYRGRAARQKKLDTGEFYSEETIQTALETHSLIQAAVATGQGRPFVGALIFIDKDLAKRIAGAAPDGSNAAEFYAKNDAVRAAVKDIVQASNAALAESGTAKKWEQVRQWEIVPIEPTVENGMMTPTMKVKSEVVLQRFAELINAMYARPKA